MRRKLVFLILTLLLTLTGCNKSLEINILSDEKFLLLPFYIEKVYGKLQMEDASINLFSVSNGADFIRLLNLTKYNVIITDNITYDFIKMADPTWIKVCDVAVKKPAVYKLLRKPLSDSQIYKTFALNTPLYRKFADKSTVFVDSTDKLFTEKKIYFKKILKGFKPIEKIGSVRFYLCVRKNSVAFKSENLKKIILSFEDGLIYMKDPAVVKYVTSIENIKPIREVEFINCR